MIALGTGHKLHHTKKKKNCISKTSVVQKFAYKFSRYQQFFNMCTTDCSTSRTSVSISSAGLDTEPTTLSLQKQGDGGGGGKGYIALIRVRNPNLSIRSPLPLPLDPDTSTCSVTKTTESFSLNTHTQVFLQDSSGHLIGCSTHQGRSGPWLKRLVLPENNQPLT